MSGAGMTNMPELRFQAGMISPAEPVAGVAHGNDGRQALAPPWEKKEFSEFVKRKSMGGNSVDLPRLEYEDIVSFQGRLNNDITKKKSAKSGVLFAEGDVLFGKLRPYLGNWFLPTFNGLAVGDWWVLRPEGVDPIFLYSLIQTPIFQFVVNQSSGSKMPRADWKLVSESVFSFPGVISEQRKIGKFFCSLDELIAGREEALRQLESLKKAMLEKMFPQRGAKMPKLRFKGFEGEWMVKKLGDLADIVGGGTPSTDTPEFWNGDINWFSPSEIGETVFVSDSVRKITPEGLKNSSAVILPAGKTILLTSRATIGEMAILKAPATTNQGFQSLVVHPDVDVYFLFSCKPIIATWAIQHAHGSTFLEISKRALGEMTLLLPSPPEQRKIGAYFRSLDALLAARREEVVKLKQLKNAFLERMFV